MNAYDIQIEWDEGGCYITIDGDSVDPDYQAGKYTWRIEDPEQFYDRVKATILPWLMERDDAERAFNRAYSAEEDARQGFALAQDAIADARDAYPIGSPKHPDFHSVHADIYDQREGK